MKGLPVDIPARAREVALGAALRILKELWGRGSR